MNAQSNIARCPPPFAFIAKPRVESMPWIRDVVDTLCVCHAITRQEILGPRRTEDVFWLRAICMYIIREGAPLSFSAIGAVFGRDHGTVMYACARVADRASVYPEFKIQLNAWVEHFCKTSPRAAALPKNVTLVA